MFPHFTQDRNSASGKMSFENLSVKSHSRAINSDLVKAGPGIRNVSCQGLATFHLGRVTLFHHPGCVD